MRSVRLNQYRICVCFVVSVVLRNEPFFSQNKYKENYRQSMKGHYEDSGVDQKTAHAMKVRSLASNVSITFSGMEFQLTNLQCWDCSFGHFKGLPCYWFIVCVFLSLN